MTQKQTGIPRFAYQMCLALHQMGVDFEVVAPKNILSSYECPFKVTKTGKLTGHLWEQISLPRYVTGYKEAMLVSFSGLGPIFKRNHIATIHDVAFMVDKTWFSLPYRILYGMLTPMVAKKCAKIITVSNFSKDEIVRYLGVDAAKISVVYNAVTNNISDGQDSPEVDERFKEPYLLAVSSMDPRKNFKRLIEAYSESGITSHKLYIIGGKAASFGNANVDENTHSGVEFLGFVNDDVLQQAYQHASLFLYPSLYEGFGIPPIEAMSLGCPVLVSDLPVCHEVNADAAWYCDPYSKTDIIKKIQYVLDPAHLPQVQEKVQLGYAQYQKYNWRKSAQQFVDIVTNLQ